MKLALRPHLGNDPLPPPDKGGGELETIPAMPVSIGERGHRRSSGHRWPFSVRRSGLSHRSRISRQLDTSGRMLPVAEKSQTTDPSTRRRFLRLCAVAPAAALVDLPAAGSLDVAPETIERVNADEWIADFNLLLKQSPYDAAKIAAAWRQRYYLLLDKLASQFSISPDQLETLHHSLTDEMRRRLEWFDASD